ncbi:MAG TPA: tetratricopeptide repeat protein [Candidatus Heimdallarchaeota archaeon]|nr:tetratricopeptide repeat protein [Candidatus Heimdallarchaeota archaeon]
MKRLCQFFSIFLIVGFLSVLLHAADYYERGLESLDLMAYTQALQHFETAISEDPNKEDVRVSMALTYLRMKRPNDALRVLQEERFLFPNSLNARVMLAYVYFLQDNKDDAIEACEDFDNLFLEEIRKETKIEKMDPEALAKETEEKEKLTLFVPLDYVVARVYGREKLLKPEKEKDKEKVEDTIEKMLEKNPNLGIPYIVLGAIQKTSVDFEKAAQSINMALATGYDPVCCYSQLIDIEFQKSDWLVGFMTARRVLQDVGSRAEFYMLKGYAHNQLAETEAAINSYIDALRRKPYIVETRKNLARIYLSKNLFDEATALLQEAVRMDPIDFDAKYLLEQALKKRHWTRVGTPPELSKQFVDEIEVKYVHVFHTKPDSCAEIVNDYSIQLLKNGQLAHASSWLDNFLEIYDGSASLNYNLAQLYNTQEVLGKALKHAWKAAEIETKYRDAYDLIGNIFFKLQDFESSLQAYQQVIEIDSKDALAYYNIGLVYHAMKNVDSAEQHFKEAIERDKGAKKPEVRKDSSSEDLTYSLTVRATPVTFDSHRSLGEIYFGKKMLDEALEEYKQAVEWVPNDPESYYWIGKLSYDLGYQREAITNLERCVYLGGYKEKEAKALLAELKSPD